MVKIMGWLQKLFDRKKSQNQQQPVDNSDEQNSTTVVQVIVEETIMAVAQWLVVVVNQSIQSRSTAQTPPEEAPIAEQITAVEELLAKFGTLIEQVYERDQTIVPLQNRINAIETFLGQHGNFEQHVKESSQSIAALEMRVAHLESLIEHVNVDGLEALLEREPQLEQQVAESKHCIADLDNRLTAVESQTNRVDSLAEKIDQAQQNLLVLERHIHHLEKILAKFSAVPKIIEGNYRAIAALQNRMETLNPPRHRTPKSSHYESTPVIKLGDRM